MNWENKKNNITVIDYLVTHCQVKFCLGQINNNVWYKYL